MASAVVLQQLFIAAAVNYNLFALGHLKRAINGHLPKHISYIISRLLTAFLIFAPNLLVGVKNNGIWFQNSVRQKF